MRYPLATGLLTTVFTSSAFAGSFVSTNDLVVATLDSTTNAAPGVDLREYAIGGMSAPAVVNDVQFDTTGSNALRGAASTAYRDGVLNRSPDGQYLTYTGYRQDSATSDPVSNVNTPRVIGVVNGAGVVNASVSPTGVGANPIRSAATTDGNAFYYTIDGSTGSISYIKSDGTGQTPITNASYRSVFVTANDLYGSTGTTATVKGAHDFGGLPTTAVATNPPAFLPPPSGGVSISSLVAEDLSNAVGAEGVDTIYAVGDSALSKYTKVNGAWTLTGSAIPTPGGASLFGAAVRVNANGTDDVYTSTAGSVYRLIDGGYNTPLTLADGTAANFNTAYITAAAGEQFRGVAFAVPEPASLAAVALLAGGLLRRRR